jgi:5'-phosphate synthase pdxT subunit
VKVGVLSLQGDFAAHGAMLERLGAEPVYVREAGQLDDIAGLVIPGGESTTMLKLMRYEGLFEPLVAFGRRKPVFGTCAGAILMARHVTGPEQESFGLVDLDVERNAYGRQIDSRVAQIVPEPEFEARAGSGSLEAVFIRAPIIRQTGAGIQVLARYNGYPVLVEQDRHLVATFHPELTADPRVHKLFLEKL